MAPRVTELLERRSPEEAEHRLNLVVGLLTVLRNGDETATLRAMEAASKLVEDPPSEPDEMREALSALRTEDELILQEMVGADVVTAGQSLSARGQAQPKPKGRAGKTAATPGSSPNNAFEKLHPRGRGGKWIQKGEGMGSQPPSDRVKQLQSRLHELGFLLNQDGGFGVHTEEAVKAFQRKYGLKETGKVDAATVETMRNPPPKTAQQANAEIEKTIHPPKKGRGGKSSRGSRSGRSRSRSSSGSQLTLSAGDKAGIEKFQRAHGLKVDGKLGPETNAALKAVNAERARSHSKRSKTHSTRSKGGGLVRRGDGMSGQPDKGVSKIQQQLLDLGFELGAGGADGRFGGDTQKAIEALQRRYGLRVDGVVGPQTAKMIQRLLKRQQQEAKNQGYLSADQQGNVSGRRSKKLKEHAALPVEVETVDKVEEASNVGGVAANAPGSIAGTALPYGGWPGVAADGETDDDAIPFARDDNDDVLFGSEPPRLPPGLREAPPQGFARCASCVHHDAKRLCMLYSAGTDLDDLCDSWYSLTPEDARGRIVGVLTARSELTVARESADGSEVARAVAHLEHAMELLEGDAEVDQEYEKLLKKFMANGMPEAAAKKAAKKAVAKKRLAEAEEGVVAYVLAESAELFTIACPECGTEQPVSNVSCSMGGHSLADARLAKVIELREAADAFGSADFEGAYWLTEATFTADQRKSLAKKGKAMGHGGFPIRNESDLKNAIQAFGRAKNKAATKAFIVRRAKALGKTALLPSGWLQESAVQAAPKLVEVKSSAYPSLERKPGKQNWVDKAGGLPSYIERIAKHLHYEKGMQIGRAIAVAVNVVKKMCASGELNFPGRQSANAGSRAEACAAVKSWEAKKAGSKLKESLELIEAAEAEEGRAPYLSVEECLELVEALELHEARHPMSFHFDPSLHPRNRTGMFRDVLHAIERSGRGSQVTLPGGVSVKKRAGGAFTVHVGGKRKSGNFNLDKAAKSALKHAGFDTGDDRAAIPFGIRGERYNIAAVTLDPGDHAQKIDAAIADFRKRHPGTPSVARDSREMIARRVKAGYNKQQSRELLVRLQHQHSDSTLPAALAHHGFLDSGAKGGGPLDQERRAFGDHRDPGIDPLGNRVGGPGILGTIRMGDRVTIRTPQGNERSGKATLLGPGGWVLNAGGAHGTPIIADERNIVAIKGKRVDTGAKGGGATASAVDLPYRERSFTPPTGDARTRTNESVIQRMLDAGKGPNAIAEELRMTHGAKSWKVSQETGKGGVGHAVVTLTHHDQRGGGTEKIDIGPYHVDVMNRPYLRGKFVGALRADGPDATGDPIVDEIAAIGGTNIATIGGHQVRKTGDGTFEIVERDRNSYSQVYRKMGTKPGTAAEVAAQIKAGMARNKESDRSRARSEADNRALTAPKGRKTVEPFKGAVTLKLGMVPDEWAVEHGYAEWTDPRQVRVYSGYGGPSNTGETFRSIRWKPGIDAEKVLYHFLGGKKPPANFDPKSKAGQQWTYSGKGRKAAKLELIRNLTGAKLQEIAALLDSTEMGDHPSLPDMGLVESTSLVACRLPVAELIVAAKGSADVVVEAAVEVLRERLRKLAPEPELRLQEAKDARRSAVGDPGAVARADATVKLYELLGEALS